MRVQFSNKLLFGVIAFVFFPANLIGSGNPSEIDPTSHEEIYAEIKQPHDESYAEIKQAPIDAIKPKYAPGSIYLWNGSKKVKPDEYWEKWEPLVEAKYELTPITNRKSIIEESQA